MQLDVHCDALCAFDRNRRADGYTLKQHQLSIKRTAKSEQEKFSKQRPKLDFRLVTKYCQTTSTHDVGLFYSMAHEIKMLCVQQGFRSKPLA